LVALLREPAKRGLTVAQIRSEGGPRAALDRRLGLFADQAQQRASLELDDWRGRGIAPLSFADRRYPRSLRDMDRRPPLLFVRGELLKEDAEGVSVIGTRRPSQEGIKMASAIAEALTEAGRTVISGLAAGIDTAAHAAALRAGGRSIGVLGNGLDHVYPPGNATLQRQLQVLVSQFWPAQPPSRDTFPARNAVMSAMGMATVIVEAGQRSGARIQARHALAQGRRLFLMAPLLREEWARALAPQAGVRVITDPAALMDGLG
jgi:DNA processing protein